MQEFARYTAYSGSYSYCYILLWELISQNIAGNYSTVKLQAVIEVNGANNISWSRGNASLHTDNFGLASSYSRGRTVVHEMTINIGHESNGTKTQYIGGSISTSFLMNGSCGGNITLPTIVQPLQPSTFDSISNSTSYLDCSFTYKYTPKSSSTYNRLRVSIPNVVALDYVRLGQKSTSQQTGIYTLSGTLLNDIYNRYPNASSVNIGFVLETYSDSGYSNKIGESAEKTVNLTFPLSIAPIIDSVSLTEAVQEIAEQYDYFVQKQSKIDVDVVAEGNHLSTITSYNIIINDEIHTSCSCTTSYLRHSGTNNCIVSVTDSRGRTSSETIPFFVKKYDEPILNNGDEYKIDSIEVIIYNDEFEKIGTITDSESIIWHKKYNDVGEFEIYLPASSENKDLLQEDFYVVREDDDSVGIIEDFQITYDERTETDMMSVSGRFAESLLERRIIWQQTQVNGYLELGIRNLITDNVINPINQNRKIDFINLGEIKGYTETIESQYTGDNLSTVIHDICNANNIGYRMILSNKKFYFELYKGEDRSYNQNENPHIIFSDEYDNLISSKYQSNKSNYKNTGLIAGEGEGLERKKLAINDANSGINRRELFVDARDLSTNNGEIGTIEYNNMLQARGDEKVSEYKYTKSFDGEIRMDDRYIYKRDVNMGDIVTIENTEWNVGGNQRITGTIESYDSSGYEISLEFSS